MMKAVFAFRYHLCAAMLGTCLFCAAQEPASQGDNQLTIDAQIRTRGELRRGGMADNSDIDPEGKANFVQSRTRLSIDYQHTGLEMKVIAQHSGVWGQSNKGSFNLYEAWAKIETKQGLFAKVGRQELKYDDERIIGSNDWTVAAYSHDVIKVGYEGHGHKVHGILAYNQNAENTNGGTYYKNGSQPYKTMQTLWYHYDVQKVPLGASFLYMNIGMQGGDTEEEAKTNFQRVFGVYASFRPKRWAVEASYYKQRGYDEEGLEIKAWMASGKVKFDPMPMYGFVGGFDYLSGDKYFAVPKAGDIGVTRHEVVGGFNPVYGSHHQFYGAMDFFYLSTFVNGFSPGFQNAYIGGHYSPLKGLRFDASYHYLAMSTKLTDINMTLGHEIELQASYRLTQDASLSAGFSLMTGTATMEKLKRAANNHNLRWAWLSLSISPRIFSTRW